MYRTIQQSLLARIQTILLEKYQVTLTNLVVEQPPAIALGELALPVAFELAKRLRKAPRAIAAELAAERLQNQLLAERLPLRAPERDTVIPEDLRSVLRSVVTLALDKRPGKPLSDLLPAIDVICDAAMQEKR